MKKYKLLEGLINYLLVKNSSSLEESRRSPEEDTIQNLVQENLRNYTINPPENILQKLKAHEITKDFGKKERVSLRDVVRYVSALAIPGLVILVAVVTWNPAGVHKKEVVQISSIGKDYVPINKGSILEKTGIKMSSLEVGVLAVESSSDENHFLIKKGVWNIETDHTKLEKETWFHFPGGGVKPIGTKFSIQIINEKADVQLIEGKIQTYAVDKHGNIESSQIESAPFKKEFTAPQKNLMSIVTEDLIKTANSMVIAPGFDISKKEENSVYRNFIGSEITVISKDGLKIKGILENVAGGQLQIKTGSSRQRVEESKVTLVGLDSHPDRLEKDKFFPNE